MLGPDGGCEMDTKIGHVPHRVADAETATPSRWKTNSV